MKRREVKIVFSVCNELLQRQCALVCEITLHIPCFHIMEAVYDTIPAFTIC